MVFLKVGEATFMSVSTCSPSKEIGNIKTATLGAVQFRPKTSKKIPRRIDAASAALSCRKPLPSLKDEEGTGRSQALMFESGESVEQQVELAERSDSRIL